RAWRISDYTPMPRKQAQPGRSTLALIRSANTSCLVRVNTRRPARVGQRCSGTKLLMFCNNVEGHQTTQAYGVHLNAKVRHSVQALWVATSLKSCLAELSALSDRLRNQTLWPLATPSWRLSKRGLRAGFNSTLQATKNITGTLLT